MTQTIVVSAINFFQGGPLSILIDCLEELSLANYKNFQIIVLVHKKELFSRKKYPTNIEFREYPKSRQSYIYRLYYEYYLFGKESKKLNVLLWLSLHDMSPRNIQAKVKAVYCHNPTPFYKKSLKDIVYPNLFLSTWFYKYIYKFNMHSNDFIIVQQKWIKKAFMQMFAIKADKFIVAKPSVPSILDTNTSLNPSNGVGAKNEKMFFFPTFPRPFKNIEVIGEAVALLADNYKGKFEVILTIDGSENNYSAKIVEKYQKYVEIKFVGILERTQVYAYYQKADCLIFPSKLETWGLPISEFRQFNKPMFLANLPYALETAEGYRFAEYFNPDDATRLAMLMERVIQNKSIDYNENKDSSIDEGVMTQEWRELFDKLLY